MICYGSKKEEKICPAKREQSRGFTLIEILIVIGIAAIIFLFSAPYSLNFYKNQIVDDTQSNLIEVLQRARHNAILQKNDSDFGVKINNDEHNFVLFQGVSYDERVGAYDEVYDLIPSIVITDLTEIVFSKMTGLTETVGTTTITYDNTAEAIFTEGFGTISRVEVASAEEEEVSLIPTNGLVAYWSFDGNALDSVGGNNGTLQGGTVLTAGVKGVSNTAYAFDGDGDYISVPDDASLNPSSEISISVWINSGAANSSKRVMSKYYDGSMRDWDLHVDTDGTFRIQYSISNSHRGVDSNYIVNGGGWYHLVSTYTSGTQKMYVNGVEKSGGTNTGSLDNSNASLFIGAVNSAGVASSYFTGSIDNARIYNRVLTPEEVLIIYNEEKL